MKERKKGKIYENHYLNLFFVIYLRFLIFFIHHLIDMKCMSKKGMCLPHMSFLLLLHAGLHGLAAAGIGFPLSLSLYLSISLSLSLSFSRPLSDWATEKR